MFNVVCLFVTLSSPGRRRRLAGAERGLRFSQLGLHTRRERMRAAEHAPRGRSYLLERRHGLAEMVERRARVQGGCTGGILSIPVEEVSLGSPRVGTIHVQSPTPHTPPLQSFLVDFSQQTTWISHLLAMVCFQGSLGALGCCIDGVCGTGNYPLPDLPREASRSRSVPEKSVQFGPDGAPFPSKTSITRGPPVVAVAVSSDPILPHR